MAVALATQEQTLIDRAMDFVQESMENANDGDLYAAARAAAVRCKRNGLVSGLLWDEMGPQVLAQFFRLRRIHVLRRWSSGHPSSDDQGPTAADTDRSAPLDKLYHVEGTWAALGSLGRTALYALRDSRMAQANGLMFEARFFEKIAKGLKSDQTVAQRYKDADLIRIREEVSREDQ